MSEPAKWLRGDGKVRYQPRTSTGLLLWQDWSAAWMAGDGPDLLWSASRIERAEPATYRSKNRAKRVAARKERRDRKSEMREITNEEHL